MRYLWSAASVLAFLFFLFIGCQNNMSPRDPNYVGDYALNLQWTQSGIDISNLTVFRLYTLSFTQGQKDKFDKITARTAPNKFVDTATMIKRSGASSIALYFYTAGVCTLFVDGQQKNGKHTLVKTTLTIKNPYRIGGDTLLGLRENTSYRLEPRQTLAASGLPLTVSWQLDNGKASPLDTGMSFQFSPAQKGSFKIKATLNDTESVHSLAIDPLSVTVPGYRPVIDSVKPVLAAIHPGDMPAFKLGVHDQDSSSLTVIISSVKGGAWADTFKLLSPQMYASTLTSKRPIADTGTYIFTVTAVDSVGLVSKTVKYDTITVAANVPVVKFIPDTTVIAVPTDYAFKLMVTATADTFHWNIDGKDTITSVPSITKVFLTQSKTSSNVSVYGVDKYGYKGQARTAKLVPETRFYDLQFTHVPGDSAFRDSAYWVVQTARKDRVSANKAKAYWKLIRLGASDTIYKSASSLSGDSSSMLALKSLSIPGVSLDSINLKVVVFIKDSLAAGDTSLVLTDMAKIRLFRPVLKVSNISPRRDTVPTGTKVVIQYSASAKAPAGKLDSIFWKQGAAGTVNRVAPAIDTFGLAYSSPKRDTIRIWARDNNGQVSDTEKVILIAVKPLYAGCDLRAYTRSSPINDTLLQANTGDSVYVSLLLTYPHLIDSAIVISWNTPTRIDTILRTIPKKTPIIDSQVIDTVLFFYRSGNRMLIARAWTKSGVNQDSLRAQITCSKVPLAGLSISAGTLAPAFSPAVLLYTAAVQTSVTGITVTPSLDARYQATMKVNGTAATSGQPDSCKLDTGDNRIDIVTTAEDEATKNTYTVVVTRGKNSDASLQSLSLSAGTITPSFKPQDTAYAATVPSDSDMVTVNAVPNALSAAVRVNGQPLTTRFRMPPDTNVLLRVKVTAQDGTEKQYIITARRAAGTIAALDSLWFMNGTLNQAFAPAQQSYTLKLTSATAFTLVKAKSRSRLSTLKINDSITQSGTWSDTIAVEKGLTAKGIKVDVISEDQQTTTSYQIDCNRASVLTFASGTNGTVTPSGARDAYYGDTLKSAAAANTGYKLFKWRVTQGTGAKIKDSVADTARATLTDGDATIQADFIVINSNLTCNLTGNGSGSVNVPSSLQWGVPAAINATVNTGSVFDQWSVTQGSATIADPFSLSTTITATSGPVVIEAKFSLKVFILVLIKSPADGGTASGPTTVRYGIPDSIHATPAATYNFSGWSMKSGSAIFGSASNPNTTIRASEGPIDSVIATFTLKTYALTGNASPSSGGTVTVPASLTHGVATNILATPATGYNFSGWSVTGGTATFASASNASTTITATAGPVSITATFVLQTYTLTTAVSPTGAGTVPTAPGTLTYNTAATISASPATGYNFSAWSVTAGTATIANPANASTTITATAGPVAITATFTLQGIALSSTVSPASSGTITAPGSVTYNTATSISATPAAGYNFSSWSVTSGTATIATPSSASTTITATAGPVAILATFTLKQFTITKSVSPVGGGDVLLPNPNILTYGVAANITASPASCYDFTGWSLASGSGTFGSTSSATTTITTTTGDVQVQASFAKRTFGLTLSVNGTGGNVSPSTATMTCGEATLIQATPSSNYVFNTWTVTGGTATVAAPTSASTSVTGTAGPVTVSGSFLQTYTISYNGNGHTDGTVPGSQTKIHNTNLQLATNTGGLVRLGYDLTGWSNGSGTHYSLGATYSANASVTLFAEWTKLTVTDGDDNTYNTVVIGTQVWTVENLATTKYYDKTPIVNVKDGGDWASTSNPAYCFYENDPITYPSSKWGLLYNGYTITNSSHSLAPPGWHVPTNSDWAVLNSYASNSSNTSGTTAAQFLASITDWTASSTPGAPGYGPINNNKSGFSGYPVGGRWDDGGYAYFNSNTYSTLFWSSTPIDAQNLYTREMNYDNTLFYSGMYPDHTKKSLGLSVRFVKDP